jgi:dinuclear metal center YbgI/SA1388 family protein
MITRDELTGFLADLYQYQNFKDFCENGLQVEGKDNIERIVFGVSFNQPFLENALKLKPDALILHHGIFQEGVFKLRSPLKQKIKTLLEHDISLYGIHLPMDAHPEVGHNALLLEIIEAENIEPFELGFKGENIKGHSLDYILRLFHEQLHQEGMMESVRDEEAAGSLFNLSCKYGFSVLRNGPEIPENIAIISGGSSGFYEKAVDVGMDTFFGGDIKEHIPSFSLETQTNFVNLGHYYSEKPGIQALQELINEKFEVETHFLEVPNPI